MRNGEDNLTSGPSEGERAPRSSASPPTDTARSDPAVEAAAAVASRPGFADRAWAALERWGDRLNPVLVKEVRQALRSRRFMATFMLALGAALLMTLIALGAGALEHATHELKPRAGLVVFMWLYGCFAVIATVLVPFGVYGRFLADQAQASVDLVQITRLSAHRIMLGRLEAAGVTLMLYVSAIVPFSTFAYLLRGLTPGMIAFGIFVAVAAGVTMVNFVLFTMSLLPRKHSGGLALLGCLFAAFYVTGGGVVAIQAMGRGWGSPADFWLGFGISAAVAVPLNAVLFTVAAARTSFPSANKETGPRLALLALNLVVAGSMLVAWFVTGDDDVIIGMTFAALIWWGFVGLFVHAVPVEMSERVKRASPRWTLLGFLFWPGRGRAFAFHVAGLALICLPLAAVLDWDALSSSWRGNGRPALGCAILYALVFPPLPAAIFGRARRAWGWPRSIPKAVGVFFVCYFAGWLMMLGILAAYSPYGNVEQYASFHALNPIAGVICLFDGGKEKQLVWNAIVISLMALATLGHMVPLAARGFVESWTLARERRRERAEARKASPADGIERAGPSSE